MPPRVKRRSNNGKQQNHGLSNPGGTFPADQAAPGAREQALGPESDTEGVRVLGLIEEALSKAEAASEGVNEETEDITEGEAEPEPDQAESGGDEEAAQTE